jgi:hypothetical protein
MTRDPAGNHRRDAPGRREHSVPQGTTHSDINVTLML